MGMFLCHSWSFLRMRANKTGTFCLKWIPNHCKHPSLRWESNPQTAKLNTKHWATQPAVGYF